MNNQTADRESGNGNGFHGDRRVVLEELDDEIEGDGEREFAGDDERRAVLIDEGDMVAGVEEERGEKQGKGRGRRAVLGLGVVDCHRCLCRDRRLVCDRQGSHTKGEGAG